MKTTWILLVSMLLNISFSYSQDKDIVQEQMVVGQEKEGNIVDLKEITKNIFVSAYFQGQYQTGQKDVKYLSVGSDNENYGEKSFSRFGLRRAYVSTMYQQGRIYALFTLEARDNRDIWFSDAFINIIDPWTERFDLSVGAFNPDFGYELSISPSKYELVGGTPFLYSLFPDIYDIGAKLTYNAPEKYANLRVNASLLGGNGVQQETDSRKDFSGSIFASTDKTKPMRLSGGVAYYHGSVYQGTENVYKMKGKEFVLNNSSSNEGSYAKREYLNVNLQLALESSIGLSQLRGEYVTGTQPAGKDFYDSPNSKYRPMTDTYIRNFNGGSIYYLQQIGPKLPLTFWGGYSWHDPNTKVSGDDVGKYNTNETDLKYQIASVGLIWFPMPSIRLQAFYEMPFNEKSINLANIGYDKHKKENVLTLRIQYKY